MTPADQTPGTPNLDALFQQALGDHRAGRLDEAAAAYRQILAQRPEIAEVHNNLGILCCQQGRPDDATLAFEQAVALKPDLADAHNNLASVLAQQGKFERAAAHYERVIALQPDSAVTHHRLGILLRSHGQLERAAAYFRQALALRPSSAEAHNDLGIVLWKQDQLDEAAARFEQAIALRPHFAEAHNNLGSVLWKQGRLEEAAAHLRQAVALRPELDEAHHNLGSILAQQDKLDEAAGHFQQAIALRPDYPEAQYSLGKVLLNQDRIEAALPRFEQALAQRPDYGDAQFALATCYLLSEDYRHGWPAFEGRLRTGEFQPPPGARRWTGQSLTGRRLLLVAEQGLGDTLQFVRYARVFKQRGAHVVMAVQAALGPLLAHGTDWDELFLIGGGQAFPPADFYLPLLSAPYALLPETSAIPREVPYLAADAGLMSDWRGGAGRGRGPTDRDRLARLARFSHGSLAINSAIAFRSLGPAARRAIGQPAKRLWNRADCRDRFSAARSFQPAG